MLNEMRWRLARRLIPPMPETGAVNVKQSAEDLGAAVISGSRGGPAIGRASEISRKELLDSYNRMPWLRAVVHKVAHSSAMVTWQLFVMRNVSDDQRTQVMRKLQRADRATRQRIMKEMVQRKQAEFEEITDHPMLDLLNMGSDLLPGPTGSQLVQIHMDLTGEAFQLKDRKGVVNPRSRRGVPSQLMPIPPHWVQSLPTPEHPFFEVQLGRTADAESIRQEDVIMYRDPNPRDPFGRGSGTAASLADTLHSNDAGMGTIRSRLEQNAVPPFVAMPETEPAANSGPDREQLDRIREEWERRLAGPNKSGFVHFLKKKFKIEKLGGTFEELSLIPLLENQRNTIIQVYGIPPELVGVIENSNRATIDAAELLFARHVLMPRLEMRRAVLQQALVPEFDDRLILDFESPVPEDEEAQREIIKSQPWAFQADEIRERGGVEALEDEEAGGSHAVPSNVFIQPGLTGAPVEDPEDPESPDDEGDQSFDLDDEPFMLAHHDVQYLRGADGVVPLGNADAPHWCVVAAMNGRSRGRALGPVGRARAGARAARVARQARDTRIIIGRQVGTLDGRTVYVIDSTIGGEPRERRTKQIDDDDIRSVTDAVDQRTLNENTEGPVRNGIEKAGQQRLNRLGVQIAFDIDDPKVIEFMANYSSTQIKGINDTTKAAVRATLAEGVQNGEGINQLARRVRGTFDAARGKRSSRIARTESVRAMNRGQMAATEQAGMEGKQWLCVAGDTRLSGFGIDSVSRRWHSGPMVTLRTAGNPAGITVTPDHEVLTRRGWVPAHRIKAGDHLVSYKPEVERLAIAPGGQVPDVDYVKPKVSEVFDAVSDMPPALGTVPTVVNLDSEGGSEDINVVLIDPCLLRDLEPLTPQHARNRILELSDRALGLRLRSGPLGFDRGRDAVVLVASDSGGHLGAPLLRGHDAGAGLARFAAAPDLDAMVAQNPDDGAAGASVLCRQGGDGSAVDVLFDYDICLGQEIVSGGCHVYDCSTATGWLVADNGLVIHNSTRDPAVRDSHVSLDSQKVRVKDNFVSPVTGAAGPHPGALGLPGEDINCRCTIISVPRMGEEDVPEETGPAPRDFSDPKKTPTQQFREIRDWAKPTFIPLLDETLVAAQRQAIRRYTGIAHDPINRRLRTGDTDKPDFPNDAADDRIKQIDSALDQATVPEDVIAWRGISMPAKMFDTDDIDEALVGTEVRDRGFGSTSMRRGVAEFFVESENAGVITRITVPKGTRGAYIGFKSEDFPSGRPPISDFDEEAELLLQRGMRYRIESVTETEVMGRTVKEVSLRIVGNEKMLGGVARTHAKQGEDEEPTFPSSQASKFLWSPDEAFEIVPPEDGGPAGDDGGGGQSANWPPHARTEQERIHIWRAAERVRKPIEKELRAAFRRGFARQEKEVLISLRDLED